MSCNNYSNYRGLAYGVVYPQVYPLHRQGLWVVCDFANHDEAKEACIMFLENLGINNVREKKIHKGYPVMLLEKGI